MPPKSGMPELEKMPAAAGSGARRSRRGEAGRAAARRRPVPRRQPGRAGRDAAVALVVERPPEHLARSRRGARAPCPRRPPGRASRARAGPPRRRPGPSSAPGPSSSSASGGRPRASPGSSRRAATPPASTGRGSVTTTPPTTARRRPARGRSSGWLSAGHDRDPAGDHRPGSPRSRQRDDRRRRLLAGTSRGRPPRPRAPCRRPARTRRSVKQLVGLDVAVAARRRSPRAARRRAARPVRAAGRRCGLAGARHGIVGRRRDRRSRPSSAARAGATPRGTRWRRGWRCRGGPSSAPAASTAPARTNTAPAGRQRLGRAGHVDRRVVEVDRVAAEAQPRPGGARR